MIIYIILLLIPSLYSINLALINPHNNKFSFFNNISWNLFFFFTVCIVGLRYEVGTDWGTYLRIYEHSQTILYSDFLKLDSHVNDYGYILLNKLSTEIGAGIYGVNLVSAFLFLFGVFIFCKRQINPWLSLALCVPYLIIVVGMGFTRQAIAVGLVLYALTFFYENKIIRFAILVFVAATFHDSAILNMLLLFLLVSQKLLKKLILILFFVVILFIFLYFFSDIQDYILDRINYYYRVYFKNAYNSSGAYLRLLILFITSVFFLSFSLNRININQNEKKVLVAMSLISIILFILLFFVNSNAVIDRLSIYLYPIFITSAGLIPQVFNKNKNSNIFSIFIILLINTFVLYVWLNFAFYSDRWLPYNFIN